MTGKDRIDFGAEGYAKVVRTDCGDIGVNFHVADSDDITVSVVSVTMDPHMWLSLATEILDNIRSHGMVK